MKNYRMIEVIGDGTYGTVWKANHLETGEIVAIKKLKNKVKSWEECKDLKEVKALSKLRAHQNIIKLKELIRESNSDVYFVFEHAQTNLYEYIEKIKKKKETIPEFKIKEIIYQITNGLSFIHSNRYFHRDLKPENILMIIDDNQGSELCVKIADFGLAKQLPNYYDNIPLTDYVCTRWYRPPECILKSTNYSSGMDIWALGCIMVELYLLNPLFPGNSEFDQLTRVTNILGSPKFNDWPEGYKLIQKLGMKFSVTSGVHLSTIIPSASMQAINLLYEIFNWDPNKRPNCTQILANEYFDEIRSYINYKNNSKEKSNSYLDTNSYSNNQFDPKGDFSNNNQQNNNYYNSNTYLNINNNDDYLNNFNYKLYKNNNNYIPEISNTNYNFQSSNLNNNSNSNKNKLSYFAQNDMKYNQKFNSGYFFNSNFKQDYGRNQTNNNNTNFYYEINPNKQSNITSNMGIQTNRNNHYKSDIENKINNENNNNYYARQSTFNFPQIYI